MEQKCCQKVQNNTGNNLKHNKCILSKRCPKTMLITMRITIITSEINPILHCVLDDSSLLQCRIGSISEVIMIGIIIIVISIVNPMPLFQSLFCNPILSFFPKTFLHLFPLLFSPLRM